MTGGDHVLAVDQGTTSTRSIVFDRAGQAIFTARRDVIQIYPRPGWVEHDPEDIWRGVQATMAAAIAEVGAAAIAAIGVTNQRETLVIWDRSDGRPIHPAIVWQDRRTVSLCARLNAEGHGAWVRQRTGLPIDPYFSGPKIAWILDNVPGARARAERGDLAAGTIDSFLLWRLTAGAVHATDPTNAGRTLLFDIHRQAWDEDLLRLLDVPVGLLPEVRDNSGDFGATDPALFGRAIPITGLAGDQQAALFGQACFTPGQAKATYGTGGFALLNIGRTPTLSGAGLLTTPAYRLNGVTTYAMEGSIFAAGSAVQWLRDGLGVITNASQTESLAAQVSDNHGIYMVPAFAGLGAPHWSPASRGLICGLTLDATPSHLARAALEATGYQTWDLLEAMSVKGMGGVGALRIDGGMAANGWLCQFLADILQAPVERPVAVESTALGAAFLAGLAVGLWPDLDAVARCWTLDRRYEPRMESAQRQRLLSGWRKALASTLAVTPSGGEAT